MQENKKLEYLLKNYDSLSESLKKALKHYQRGRQTRVFMSCIFWWIVYFLGLLLVFLLIERTPIQSELLRFLAAIGIYASLVFWLIRGIKALVSPPDSANLAVEIEKEQESDKFNSGLSSAAEFLQQKPDRGTSELLKKLTIANVAEQLKTDDIAQALKAFSRKQSAITMLLFVMIVFVWYSISPLEVATGARRLIFPLRAIAPYTSLSIDLSPGDTVVARGENLEISAVPSRDTNDSIRLELFEPDQPESTSSVEMYPDTRASASRFVYNLNALQDSVDYQVSCEKYNSKRYSIKVMPRPDIKKLLVTLYQPTYISDGPTELPEGKGDANAIKGSKVKIKAIADQTLTKAQIALKPGGIKDCQIENNNSFTYEFKLATDTSYSIYLKNGLGLENEKPIQYNLTAVTDASPTVEILKPGRDMPFPKTKRIDIKAISRDDFGVKAMILYFRIGDRRSLVPHNLKPDFKPVKEYEVEFPWLLDTLAVQPGVKISYFVQAEDAKEPEPNIATTSTWNISMPSMYDVYRGEEMTQEEVNQKLQEFFEAQKMRRESLMKAYEQIKHEEKLDYESQKAIENALKEGEKQQQQAKKILNNLKELEEKMEDNPMSSPQALERMQKVSELLNEVLDEDTKRMMKQLRESLEQMKLNPEQLEKYQQAFKMDEYMKGLDRTIELLEQVREQQKFNSLGQAIEDLAKRQKELASQTAALQKKQQESGLNDEEKAKLKDLTDQQEKIGQELEQLQKQSEEMTQKRDKKEFQQNPLLEEVKNLRDRMKNSDHQKINKEISEQMKKQNLDSASKQQQQMLKFLESLKKNAQKICKSCSGGTMPQLDLSDFIRRALNISINQENLNSKIKDLPSQFMRGQRPEIEGLIDQVSWLQVLVRQQGSKLEYDLEKFVKSSFSVDPTAIEAIKGTQSIFASIVKDLEDRSLATANEDQQEIIRRFNQLAQDLMRAQDQQNSGSSSSDPMNALQQFKDLTRRQLSLYRKMMQQQMQPGSQQMMQQLQQMAMEQRQIREALQKLMRESRQQMNTLGRLDDVINEMKDLETEMLDPTLKRKVAERQKRIYERMLRAQKSIRNRKEKSEEREARKAREIIQQSPDKPIGDIGTDSLDLSKDFLTDLKEDFPESYKDKIRDYYRSLNVYGENQ